MSIESVCGFLFVILTVSPTGFEILTFKSRHESCAIAKMTARWPLRRYGHSKLSKVAAAAILNLFESKIAPLDPPSPKTPPYNQTWSGSDYRLRRYRHLKFFQHGGGRHLGFVRTVNSVVRSAVPENPTLEPNMKWIGSPVAEIWPFAYIGGIWNPHLGEGEVVEGKRWHH